MKVCLHSVIANGDSLLLRSLLQRKPNIHKTWFNDKNALHVAAQYGARACAKILLAYGCEVDERTTGWFQKTALHLAVENGERGLAVLLLEHQADINARVAGTAWVGWTPLHIASSKGDISMIRVLLECGANGFLEDSNGRTAGDVADRERVREFVLSHRLSAKQVAKVEKRVIKLSAVRMQREKKVSKVQKQLYKQQSKEILRINARWRKVVQQKTEALRAQGLLESGSAELRSPEHSPAVSPIHSPRPRPKSPPTTSSLTTRLTSPPSAATATPTHRSAATKESGIERASPHRKKIQRSRRNSSTLDLSAEFGASAGQTPNTVPFRDSSPPSEKGQSSSSLTSEGTLRKSANAKEEDTLIRTFGQEHVDQEQAGASRNHVARPSSPARLLQAEARAEDWDDQRSNNPVVPLNQASRDRKVKNSVVSRTNPVKERGRNRLQIPSERSERSSRARNAHSRSISRSPSRGGSTQPITSSPLSLSSSPKISAKASIRPSPNSLRRRRMSVDPSMWLQRFRLQSSTTSSSQEDLTKHGSSSNKDHRRVMHDALTLAAKQEQEFKKSKSQSGLLQAATQRFTSSHHTSSRGEEGVGSVRRRLFGGTMSRRRRASLGDTLSLQRFQEKQLAKRRELEAEFDKLPACMPASIPDKDPSDDPQKIRRHHEEEAAAVVVSTKHVFTVSAPSSSLLHQSVPTTSSELEETTLRLDTRKPFPEKEKQCDATLAPRSSASFQESKSVKKKPSEGRRSSRRRHRRNGRRASMADHSSLLDYQQMVRDREMNEIMIAATKAAEAAAGAAALASRNNEPLQSVTDAAAQAADAAAVVAHIVKTLKISKSKDEYLSVSEITGLREKATKAATRATKALHLAMEGSRKQTASPKRVQSRRRASLADSQSLDEFRSHWQFEKVNP